jgi:CheY-like chemotaxis protein
MSEKRHFRCLLVEDVEAMRALLCILLEGIECEVIAAESLTAARKILRSQTGNSFDFVVLDLELPDGNGLELLPEVDESVRVIALTADDSREAHLQCRRAGCEVVLSKSDELAKLKDIIRAPSAAVMGADRSIPVSSYPYICYLAETRLELEEVRRKSDLLGLRRIAHRLRGTAVHFGHPGIGRIAKSISSALAAGNLERAGAEAEALSTRIGDVLEMFHLRKHAVPEVQTQPCKS